MVRSNSVPLDAPNARADSMYNMTTEERAVLAWEQIADELTLLNQSLARFLDREAAPRAALEDGPPPDGPDNSEVGTMPTPAGNQIAERESHQQSVESFSVAGHSYPNLQKAFK